MLRDFNIQMRSCVELSALAFQLDYDHWKAQRGGVELISLAKLAEAYEKKSVEKVKNIRLGNWAAEGLSEGMIECERSELVNLHFVLSFLVIGFPRFLPFLLPGVLSLFLGPSSAPRVAGSRQGRAVPQHHRSCRLTLAQ